jgi:hypothetical protein
MSGSLSTFSEPDADFDAIEQAVMETERGRSFLKEFARRNRYADTQVLLTSLSRIEKSIALRETSSAMDEFRTDILEMADVIARSRQEIASLQPDSQGMGPFVEASDHLESIVLQTEATTSAILAAAESIQESAWTLRETGADAEQCATLDDLATVIYTSCSSQDVTIQRTRKIISTLHFLENRLSSLAEICGVNSTRGLQTDQTSAAPRMSQEDIDFVLVEDGVLNPNTAQFEQPLAPRYFEMPLEAEAVNLPEPMPHANPEGDLDFADPGVIDDMLFDREAALMDVKVPVAVLPLALVATENAEPPQVTDDIAAQEPISDELQKVRAGIALNANEAAAALDALKAMSLEKRTQLFS